MAQITEIYKRYKIMPSLQEHQLRVAAVAKQICDNFEKPVNQGTIIKACLIHDMGNILKSDLTQFPGFLEPEGLEYWEEIKRQTVRKYHTTDSHHLSLGIASELNMPTEVIELVNCITYSNTKSNSTTKNFGKKICAYSDMRVGPYGVIPLEDRIADLHIRYAGWKNTTSRPRYEADDNLREIEKQIFAHASIRPPDITDESIRSIVEQLRTYEI
ncbi:MAG: HD domain-containing protein [Candidatus Saccharimonadales bacterium]|jgi:hypothetical protein